MKHRSLMVVILVALSLVGHAALAQLHSPAQQAKNKKCKDKVCATATTDGGTAIKVRGQNRSFVVVSRFGDFVMDAQVVAGNVESVEFLESMAQGAEFDVLELRPVGSVGIEGFKPCHPGESPNEPNCTPVGWPPRPPVVTRFAEFAELFADTLPN